MTVVHLIRDYENRHGKMYCGFAGTYLAQYESGDIMFSLETGNIMLATTAMCEVTCERCQTAMQKFRKARRA